MKTEKYTTGRIESKYSLEKIGKLIGMSNTQLCILGKEDEQLAHVLMIGIIVKNEKDNDKFWKDMKIIKEKIDTSISFDRNEWEYPKTKKWQKVEKTLLSIGLNFLDEYGIEYKILSEYFYYLAKREKHLEFFYREVDSKTDLPREIFQF